MESGRKKSKSLTRFYERTAYSVWKSNSCLTRWIGNWPFGIPGFLRSLRVKGNTVLGGEVGKGESNLDYDG